MTTKQWRDAEEYIFTEAKRGERARMSERRFWFIVDRTLQRLVYLEFGYVFVLSLEKFPR